MSRPRLIVSFTLTTLLACTSDPLADPSTTGIDSDTGTGAAASTTSSSSDPTTGGPSSTDPTTTTTTTTGDPDPVCGDGHKDDGEACDNGAQNGDSQACTADCALNVCGDGKLGPGEACDDGNLLDGDDCTAQCAAPDCGDGLPGVDEACDDANVDNTDECTNACTTPVCGDGFVQPTHSEQCDDAADNNPGAICTPDCLNAVCGDSYTLEGIEQCDSGPGNGDDQACTAGCLLNVCGDGKQGPSEGCDDGNVLDGDDCSAQCVLPTCGDGIVGKNEACDDGNLDNTDECTDTCTAAVCGDGFTQPSNSELCDDGAQNGDNKACTAACLLNVCGDGKLGPGEACDDGNLEDDDGCSAKCVPAPNATTLKLKFTPIKHFDFSWAASPGATFYQLLESPVDGAPYQQLGGDIAGVSVSVTMPLHLRFGARYILRACNDGGCTAAAPLAVVDSMVGAIGYFKASNMGAGDVLGAIDVELSADGNTLAVGAQQEDSAATGIDGDQADNTAGNSGAVYIFVRVNEIWSQQAYIKASNTGAGDVFGQSLALSADGNTLAVGAFNEDSAATGINGDQADNTAVNSGAIYVFTRAGTVWSQGAYLKSSNGQAGDQFGSSVALSADGDTLASSSVTEDSVATGVGGNQADNTSVNSGAVYVFRRVNQAWSQQAYVKPSNTGAGDNFGTRLTLSGHGDTLAIGANLEDSAAVGVDGNQADNTSLSAGAVYVFLRMNDVWSQQAYVKASNTGAGDQFGADVTLSDDGSTLAVGVRFEDSNATGINGDQANNAALDAGAAYIFRRENQVWSQEAYLKASNTGESDNFGVPLVLSADGNTLAVGSNLEDSEAIGIGGDQADEGALSSGAVYLFTRANQAWSQRAYIKASNTDVGDTFGAGVGISADGNTLAVGAYQEDSPSTGIGGSQNLNTAASAGAVYLY